MMMSTLNKPDAIDLIDRLESENRNFREINIELLEALKYARRFLDAYNVEHDTQYVDAAIAKSKAME
jgi:hypothetical protein